MDHALMLAAAYDRLGDERFRSDGRPESEGLPIAALVMGSLSIEIALKAIIAFERGFSTSAELRKDASGHNGHNLKYLFGRLSESSQALIRRHVAESRPANWIYTTSVKATAIDRWPAVRMKHLLAASFDEELGLVATTFEAWRYHYEFDLVICNKTFVELLMAGTQEALKSCCGTNH